MELRISKIFGKIISSRKFMILQYSSVLKARFRETGLSPPAKYFDLPFQGGASFVDHLCYFCLVLLCFNARLVVTCLERVNL